jgi:hypothetical protein
MRGRKTVNQRYRLILNEPGFEFDNLLLQTGDHLLLQSGTVANPDILKLQSSS